ncbi:MAG: histidinol-phosphatase, partial [Candidatus Hydrogenedentes bacterium]|nr:histidinol-phosphatase [Candidatus Hydrogenedentota bacterium]
MHRELGIFFRLTIPLLLGVLAPAPCEAEWYKGVTHVHSLWSDGDTAPEVIAAWYKERGYNFAAFSEHHVLQEGDKYFSIMPDSYLTPADVEEIKQQFDEDWVEIKQEGNSTRMRLKTHEELKKHFDEPGKFLLFPAEEITSLGGPHVNALNIREAIKGERGDYAVLIQHYIDQVNAQRQQYGLPMIAHVNHINFSDGVTTEGLLK